MLVVISDLHLTDGTSGETIKAGAFERFAGELSSLATQASVRSDDTCAPVDGVDVLLLGDIIDVIRSSRWLDHQLRPWDDADRIAPVVHDITAATLAQNAESLAYLRKRKGALPVRLNDGATVEVPLRLHFMVGNHDWMYHLPGAAYDASRKLVRDAFGLADGTHGDDGIFLHSVDDIVVGKTRIAADDEGRAGPLRDLMRAHGVVARHGDVFDAFNYDASRGRDASSLGDCMVIELLNRFPHAVAQRLGLPLDDRLILGLREIDNVRPLLMIPTWLLSVLRREEARAQSASAKAPPSVVKDVMAIWGERVDAFLENRFVRSLDKAFWPDLVDGLELALTLSKHNSVLELTSALPNWMQRLLMGTDSYAKQALTEHAIVDGSASFAVYGHTHHAEIVPLSADGGAGADGADSVGGEQLHLNSGTWRCVHERCIKPGAELSFSARHVMTWLTFYADNERKGRRFETWSGQLDVRRRKDGAFMK
jgi:hypothetical protein